MHYFMCNTSSSSQCGSLRDFYHTLEQFFNDIHFWVSNIVVNLCAIGNNIWSKPSLSYNIMHSRFLRNMLSHHVNHMIHSFNTIQCRSTFIGRTSCMSWNTFKAKFCRFVSIRWSRISLIYTTWMPMQHDIDIIK